MALKHFAIHAPALCVIDVELKGSDGFNLVARIKEHNNNTIIAFLTLRENREDILQGLRLGAAEYIKASLDNEEIALRIKRLMTYSHICREEKKNVYEIGAYLLDTNLQTLTNRQDGNIIQMTYKECELLRMLASKPGEVIERDWTLKTLWANDTYFCARSMDVYVSKLRRMLKEDTNVKIINKRGRGYVLEIKS
ncbi:MAG: response regulator transcription factor [Paludibacteraceae bacterium]|nr:response regulator transcription factor [Paludibacteraceae bacterium]